MPLTPTAAAAPPAAKGCSTIVVLMLSVLAFVLGLVAGASGLAIYIKNSSAALQQLGITTVTSQDGQKVQCPVCTGAPKAPSRGYALVYPIEQSLVIQGQLQPSILRTYVIRNRSKIQKCYQTELDATPSLAGEMSLQFTISGLGKVIAAVVRHDAIGNESLKNCVLEEIKTWKFQDKEVGSDIAVVKVDVLFAPIGQ